jgi:hypothetical protein
MWRCTPPRARAVCGRRGPSTAWRVSTPASRRCRRSGWWGVIVGADSCRPRPASPWWSLSSARGSSSAGRCSARPPSCPPRPRLRPPPERCSAARAVRSRPRQPARAQARPPAPPPRRLRRRRPRPRLAPAPQRPTRRWAADRHRSSPAQRRPLDRGRPRPLGHLQRRPRPPRRRPCRRLLPRRCRPRRPVRSTFACRLRACRCPDDDRSGRSCVDRLRRWHRSQSWLLVAGLRGRDRRLGGREPRHRYPER